MLYLQMTKIRIMLILIITKHKLHVLVVTLSAKGNQKLSKHLSKGFERSVQRWISQVSRDD